MHYTPAPVPAETGQQAALELLGAVHLHAPDETETAAVLASCFNQILAAAPLNDPLIDANDAVTAAAMIMAQQLEGLACMCAMTTTSSTYSSADQWRHSAMQIVMEKIFRALPMGEPLQPERFQHQAQGEAA